MPSEETRPTVEWELDQSRQVRSPWAWRGMLFLSLIAIGVGIILVGNRDTTLGILWLVIAAGWFGFAMMLWRRHSSFMRGT